MPLLREALPHLQTRLDLANDDDIEWSIPLSVVIPYLETLQDDSNAQVAVDISGNLACIKKDDVHLMPPRVQIEYWKLRGRQLEQEIAQTSSDKMDLDEHEQVTTQDPGDKMDLDEHKQETEEKDGKDYTFLRETGSMGANSTIYNNILEGSRLAHSLNSAITDTLDTIRLFANARGSTVKEERKRRRVQCIVAGRTNADLLKALCDCGDLDPAHLTRKHIQAAIDNILGSRGNNLARIDKYIADHPSEFRKFTVDRGVEVLDFQETEQALNDHCLHCISEAVLASTAPACTSRDPLNDEGCIQCEVSGASHCRMLCESCTALVLPDQEFSKEEMSNLNDDCEFCVKLDLPIKQLPAKHDGSAWVLNTEDFDKPLRPQGSHLLWDNDGLDLGNAEVAAQLEAFSANHKAILSMTTNELRKIPNAAIRAYKEALQSQDTSAGNVLRDKLQWLYNILASMYNLTGRFNVRNAAALLAQTCHDQLKLHLGNLEPLTSSKELIRLRVVFPLQSNKAQQILSEAPVPGRASDAPSPEQRMTLQRPGTSSNKAVSTGPTSGKPSAGQLSDPKPGAAKPGAGTAGAGKAGAGKAGASKAGRSKGAAFGSSSAPIDSSNKGQRGASRDPASEFSNSTDSQQTQTGIVNLGQTCYRSVMLQVMRNSALVMARVEQGETPQHEIGKAVHLVLEHLSTGNYNGAV
ncbi:hypothetical protein Slin15195_G003060 [Septoria linicola]|uniref:Uncharacterized protein n=1 Tax=Septoria linicola TaxID=215465 RepID=A0A9Q9ADL9_9PEZI|nr:hypothetical protein Slin14017_G003080 [Septoria linicola]USW46987.1 hypothetical protein Slin15195_G003060 [Septoria linicola]